MGMPITIEISDKDVHKESADHSISLVFDYFKYVDDKFSTYKDTSEISAINNGTLSLENSSDDMKLIFALSEETKKLSDGYFEITKLDGKYDPSGIVKGWAIYNSSEILKKNGCKNFYVDLGGDIQTFGKNEKGENWRVGIRDPFNKDGKKVVKIVSSENLAMATSGTYLRGQHIYNPKKKTQNETDIVSLSVIGPNIYEADRFATAAFAMGKEGIMFIENLSGFEGYMIDIKGIAIETSGFNKYVQND